MERELIFYPVIAMAGLTFAVAFWLIRCRFAAVYKSGLSPTYYHYNRGGKPPKYMLRASQNFDNLMELPTLFYVLAVMLYVTSHVDLVQIVLAWCFVGFRFAHSYVHVTSNRLMQRMWTFAFSVVMLVTMWVYFAVRFLGG